LKHNHSEIAYSVEAKLQHHHRLSGY